MNKSQVFIGDIYKCEDYNRFTTFKTSEEEIGYSEYKCDLIRKNAVIIKINQNKYIELLELRTILDYLKVYMESKNTMFVPGDKCISYTPVCYQSPFIEEKSLKPYFKTNDECQISLRALKKEVKNHTMMIQ